MELDNIIPYSPLDFVVTPHGSVAIIKERNERTENCDWYQYSIEFIGECKVINGVQEKNAWWVHGVRGCELKRIDSLPSVLSRMTFHPFGHGEESANKVYLKKV